MLPRRGFTGEIIDCAARGHVGRIGEALSIVIQRICRVLCQGAPIRLAPHAFYVRRPRSLLCIPCARNEWVITKCAGRQSVPESMAHAHKEPSAVRIVTPEYAHSDCSDCRTAVLVGGHFRNSHHHPRRPTAATAIDFAHDDITHTITSDVATKSW